MSLQAIRHWVWDEALGKIVEWLLWRVWYALTDFIGTKLDLLFGRWLEGLFAGLLEAILKARSGRPFVPLLDAILSPCLAFLPDLAAVFNGAIVFCGVASLIGAAFPTPLRRAFVVGGFAGVAIGAVREASRKNPLRQLGSAA